MNTNDAPGRGAWLDDLRTSTGARAAGVRAPRRAGTRPVTRPSVSPRDLRARVAQFVDGMSFEIQVPGQHAGGISNQELFEILADEGRDFGAPSTVLNAQVRTALLDEFARYPRMPGAAQLAQFAESEIVDRVVARMERTVRDVPIRPNDPIYLRWKIRNGFDSRPGIKTGELLRAVKRARVAVSFAP